MGAYKYRLVITMYVVGSVGNRPEFHKRLSVFINRLIIDYLIGVGVNGIYHHSKHILCLFVVVYIGSFARFLFSLTKGIYLHFRYAKFKTLNCKLALYCFTTQSKVKKLYHLNVSTLFGICQQH